MTAVRALAFGDLEGTCWGAAWMPEGAEPILALGGGPGADARPASLTTQRGAEEWRVEAEAVELIVSPVADLVPCEQGSSSDQLCRVSGRIQRGGLQDAVDLFGWRAESPLDVGQRLGSLRQVCAWFEPDGAVALRALRPEKAQGQDADLISAALLEPRATGRISDPRLSTTYDEQGRPIRAGLELWIGGESPGEEGEEDAEQQYSRRLAGESLGARVEWAVDGLALQAALFRWHYRERYGAGVYLLGVTR
jgi:hypothetical protein